MTDRLYSQFHLILPAGTQVVTRVEIKDAAGQILAPRGAVEANLVKLNEDFKLPYISELIERKLAGPEKSALSDVDVEFHRREFERLRGLLEDAYRASSLPETPAGRVALNDLLISLRLKTKATN